MVTIPVLTGPDVGVKLHQILTSFENSFARKVSRNVSVSVLNVSVLVSSPKSKVLVSSQTKNQKFQFRLGLGLQRLICMSVQ